MNNFKNSDQQQQRIIIEEFSFQDQESNDSKNMSKHSDKYSYSCKPYSISTVQTPQLKTQHSFNKMDILNQQISKIENTQSSNKEINLFEYTLQSSINSTPSGAQNNQVSPQNHLKIKMPNSNNSSMTTDLIRLKKEIQLLQSDSQPFKNVSQSQQSLKNTQLQSQEQCSFVISQTTQHEQDNNSSFSFNKDATFNNLPKIESFPGSAKNEFAHFLNIQADFISNLDHENQLQKQNIEQSKNPKQAFIDQTSKEQQIQKKSQNFPEIDQLIANLSEQIRQVQSIRQNKTRQQSQNHCQCNQNSNHFKQMIKVVSDFVDKSSIELDFSKIVDLKIQISDLLSQIKSPYRNDNLAKIEQQPKEVIQLKAQLDQLSQENQNLKSKIEQMQQKADMDLNRQSQQMSEQLIELLQSLIQTDSALEINPQIQYLVPEQVLDQIKQINEKIVEQDSMLQQKQDQIRQQVQIINQQRETIQKLQLSSKNSVNSILQSSRLSNSKMFQSNDSKNSDKLEQNKNFNIFNTMDYAHNSKQSLDDHEFMKMQQTELLQNYKSSPPSNEKYNTDRQIAQPNNENKNTQNNRKEQHKYKTNYQARSQANTKESLNQVSQAQTHQTQNTQSKKNEIKNLNHFSVSLNQDDVSTYLSSPNRQVFNSDQLLINQVESQECPKLGRESSLRQQIFESLNQNKYQKSIINELNSGLTKAKKSKSKSKYSSIGIYQANQPRRQTLDSQNTYLEENQYLKNV